MSPLFAGIAKIGGLSSLALAVASGHVFAVASNTGLAISSVLKIALVFDLLISPGFIW